MKILNKRRKHTNAKIESAVSNMMKVFNQMAEEISSQKTKIADLELKLVTTNNYQGELLYSLKRGLQDTFQSIGNDINSLSTKLNCCENCGETFSTFYQLLVHTGKEHVTETRTDCSTSDSTFTSVIDLIEHTTNTHDSYNCEKIVENDVEKLCASNHTVTNILQVDGNDSDFLFSESDEEFDKNPVLRQLETMDSLASKNSIKTNKTATFSLNPINPLF